MTHTHFDHQLTLVWRNGNEYGIGWPVGAGVDDFYSVSIVVVAWSKTNSNVGG
jgi:hypothetical protein